MNSVEYKGIGKLKTVGGIRIFDTPRKVFAVETR